MNNAGSIEEDGFKLHYLIEGKGPDALVIGSSIYYPRSFSKELRESLRLIFVDWRGFAEAPIGESPVPSFDRLLDDIDQVRQALGLKKCIIIGHSAHGLLALEYAKKYQQHISHVVMIGISPNLSPEHAAMAERNWEESVWPERKAALAERILQFPDAKLAELPPAERFVKWNVRRAPQAWFDFHFDSSSLWQGILPNMPLLDFFYGVALKDLDTSKGLETLDLPVFLALGRFDYIIAPPGCWDPIRKKFKHLTIKIFEQSGHSPQYEEPVLFDAELLKWLKDSRH
ncbi:MAG TPA: alpha/beta hydrolase [Parachlamydiaceae bacterium]|nr:alpha/beta hydrolase [Parachlamydiaceae bacterium]